MALLRSGPAGWFNAFAAWTTGAQHSLRSLSLLRILYGFAMLWFYLTSAADRHYLWGVGATWVEPAVQQRDYPAIFRIVFSKSDAFLFDLNYGILIVLAFIFMIGWQTRIVTPILLVYSVALTTNSVVLTNGGDLVMRITLLFLVFANLSQHWSVDAWMRSRRHAAGLTARQRPRWLPDWLVNGAHNTALILCCYQIMLVYVNSGIYKLMGEEWVDGTALYYALSLDVFLPFPALSQLAWQITPFVFVGSWISIWAQVLFPVLLLWKPTRYAAILAILGMHFGIGLFLGLWPFSIAMIALDLLFIRDGSWVQAIAWAKEVLRVLRQILVDRMRPRRVEPVAAERTADQAR
ncbi:HTTM domain-containing protein [Okibacterium endophyticum]